ncbi:MAG: DegT/DnrJ/EryC1/StrS family aminotransferase [Bacteroidota bacterium]
MDKIQMVDLYSQYMEIKPVIDQAINDVINDSSFINGRAVNEFVQNLSSWNQTKHIIPCANGTDGLQVAMMALDLKPGQEVIVPAFTYIATVEVIALLGLKPVFVDVDLETFNLKVDEVEHALTDKTAAIVPVHLYGQCVDMESLNNLAKQYKLHVIEDLAQAIGAEYNGCKSGNLGDVGVTSFFPSKNLGCYGDGGALFTNDDELANKIRMIVNHGQSKKYHHDVIGVNSRLDTIQAAVLNEKLKKLAEYTLNRQNAADHYDEMLSEIPSIKIPVRSESSTHVFHQYTIKVKDCRNELKQYLTEKGIPSMIYYPLQVPKQKAYQHYTDRTFTNSEMLSKEVLSIPMHSHLTSDQLSFICETVKSFFS